MATKATTRTSRKKVTPIDKVRECLKSGGVEVGVLAGTGDHPGSYGASMVEIAVWMEFGTWRKSDSRSGAYEEWSPPRPFIQSNIDDNRDSYRKLVEKVGKRMANGKLTSEKAEALIGMKVQSDIQQQIIELREPPNTESTIASKKSDNPLIDEGHLKNSIKWVSHAG
jgi:hypothetical protein